MVVYGVVFIGEDLWRDRGDGGGEGARKLPVLRPVDNAMFQRAMQEITVRDSRGGRS